MKEEDEDNQVSYYLDCSFYVTHLDKNKNWNHPPHKKRPPCRVRGAATTSVIQPRKTNSSSSSTRMILFGLITLLLRLQVASCRKTMLTWVNGIGHSMEHMEEGKQWISGFFGGKSVVYCYNPTAMSHDEDMLGYLNDLTQAGTQKLGHMTAEVDGLAMHLKEAIAKVGKRGRVIHIAHSQGALITALASKRLTPSEMGQMEVLAFGGAAAVTKTSQTPFLRCINYYSVNDPLLLVVPQASQALRSGFAATATSSQEFCFLAPRMGDPIADHSLYGPTYAQALEWEGARFQRLYESSVLRLVHRLLLFSSVLLEMLTAPIRNFILQSLVRPIVIWCVLLYLWTKRMVQWLLRAVAVVIVHPITIIAQRQRGRHVMVEQATTTTTPSLITTWMMRMLRRYNSNILASALVNIVMPTPRANQKLRRQNE